MGSTIFNKVMTELSEWIRPWTFDTIIRPLLEGCTPLKALYSLLSPSERTECHWSP